VSKRVFAFKTNLASHLNAADSTPLHLGKTPKARRSATPRASARPRM
jgi:hypothetical protein